MVKHFLERDILSLLELDSFYVFIHTLTSFQSRSLLRTTKSGWFCRWFDLWFPTLLSVAEVVNRTVNNERLKYYSWTAFTLIQLILVANHIGVKCNQSIHETFPATYGVLIPHLTQISIRLEKMYENLTKLVTFSSTILLTQII